MWRDSVKVIREKKKLEEELSKLAGSKITATQVLIFRGEAYPRLHIETEDGKSLIVEAQSYDMSAGKLCIFENRRV